MTPELFSAVSKNLEKHEGRRLSMYLDSVGVVTCGIGHALFAPVQACDIAWWKESHVLATRDEVLKVHDCVKRGMRAAVMMMSYDETERLLSLDLRKFEAVILHTFPDHREYPQSVQIALFDMCFNLGSFVHFPMFCQAVSAKDWATAAKESNRPQVGTERNSDTYSQFYLQS